MSLDLTNVIGSFMLGSAIVYAGVSQFGHAKQPCLNHVSQTRKNVKSIIKTKRNPVLLNPIQYPLKSTNLFQLQLIRPDGNKIENFTKYKKIESAYIDRGNHLDGDRNRWLILSLAHILWYAQKSKDEPDYNKYSSNFYKELKTKWDSKINKEIVKSLGKMTTIGLTIDAEKELKKFNEDFLRSGFLQPDTFMTIFRLCKIKSIIFLHESNNNILNFEDVESSNLGYYIGYIDENTPYIVHTGRNHFLPGVGKLNQKLIELIRERYTDITELQENAPIQINCRGTVRFK
jgi:hypothetical protein